MSEAAFLLDAIKAVGFPAVIFAIWYLYHKSQVRQQKETFESNQKETRNLVDKLFALTESCLETIQYNANMMARLVEKVDGNQFCPVIKNQEGKK